MIPDQNDRFKPEICTKMLRTLSEKLGANFPVTTLSYSMVKITCLNDAFSEILELEESPVKGQSPPQKDKKRKKRKGEKKIKKNKKPKDVGHFLIQKLVKRGAGGKKGMLSCCKYAFLSRFELIILAHIQAERSQWVSI